VTIFSSLRPCLPRAVPPARPCPAVGDKDWPTDRQGQQPIGGARNGATSERATQQRTQKTIISSFCFSSFLSFQLLSPLSPRGRIHNVTICASSGFFASPLMLSAPCLLLLLIRTSLPLPLPLFIWVPLNSLFFSMFSAQVHLPLESLSLTLPRLVLLCFCLLLSTLSFSTARWLYLHPLTSQSRDLRS